MPKYLPRPARADSAAHSHPVSAAGRPRAARVHSFLRRLRAGGRSNMYGAIPYLVQAFGIDRETAFRMVCEWLDQEEAALAEVGVRVS